ncbi:DUF5357 family protein [Leptolyngbya sp. FACHB-17]|uniref:DUF5357 family protein n=1 Tax=unclassified Leptolyngbya TaxID=2650499 RepID=UPI001680A323|nr:DUF5357 family protein [Leptolyngbya sp. FACHB-17]MBD2079165.1 DUF5357 family protein [Leptolyngbya sp. FACHB-17]
MLWMNQVFKQIRDRVTLPQWASWQTLLFLSIFSVIVAALTTSPPPQIAQRIISSFGWIFLILSVWWFVYEPPVKKKLTFYNFFIGPWIVGAIICVYLFGTIEGGRIPTQTSWISWPPISSLIWSAPKFIKSDSKTKSPVYANPSKAHRQDIILVILANLIISCWFQFSFQIQNWIANNPSLQGEDFSRSGFVWQPQRFDRDTALSRGADVLNIAAQSVRTELEGKPWGQVERWLTNLDQQVPRLRQQVKEQLPRSSQPDLWTLNAEVTSAVYDLKLQALWRRPNSRQAGSELTRTCRITPVRRERPTPEFRFDDSAPPATAPARVQEVGTVQCGSITPPKQIQPTRS